jgi:protein-disulfide isomerase
MVKGWEQYAQGTERIGTAGAPVTIVAFSDFQCPFCRAFSVALDSARTKYGARISMVFRNVPIAQIHPFARPAAIAAECAGRQSQFAAYHDFLFRHQDSLGTLNWSRVASTVGVADTARFRRCLGGGDVLATLNSDSLAAQRLRVSGTPTVLVNGWRFDGAPSPHQLDSAIARELERTKHAP